MGKLVPLAKIFLTFIANRVPLGATKVIILYVSQYKPRYQPQVALPI